MFEASMGFTVLPFMSTVTNAVATTGSGKAADGRSWSSSHHSVGGHGHACVAPVAATSFSTSRLYRVANMTDIDNKLGQKKKLPHVTRVHSYQH